MTDAVLDRIEYRSNMLAVAFKMIDDAIEAFLKSNPHIPLEDGRLVFHNPASLSIYAVPHDIRSMYNLLCASVNKSLYSNPTKTFDDCVLSRAREVYKSFSLQKKEAQTVFETTEFHSRCCKFVFVTRTD